MPELPEVESLAAFLREHAVGHAVARADAASFSVLKTFDPPLRSLVGRTFASCRRRGKYLCTRLDSVEGAPPETALTLPGTSH